LTGDTVSRCRILEKPDEGGVGANLMLVKFPEELK